MRKKTLEAFAEWKLDVNVPAMLFSRVAEGETLPEICRAQEVPYSLVSRWIEETPALKSEYELARKSWADKLAQESIGIADAAPRQATDPDGKPLVDAQGKPVLEQAEVARDKLRVDTRLKVAGKLDRERYGERDAGNVRVEINLGNVAAEIVALEQRLGVRAPIDVTPPAPALPSQALPVPRESAEAPI